MKVFAFTTALVLSASAAFAQTACPTQADLDQGITLTRIDPFYSNVMTRIDGGLAEARIMTESGQRQAVSTTYAHALAVTGRAASNGTLGLTYAGDTFEMDRLNTLGRWSSDVTLLQDGVAVTTGVFRATFLEETTFEVGSCAYLTWHIRTELDLSGRTPLFQDRYFAPALGLSLGTVSVDAQGNPVSAVIFDEITIQ